MLTVNLSRSGMKNQRDWHTYLRALRLLEASAEPYLCMRANARPIRRRSSVRYGAWFGNPVAAIVAGGARGQIQHCSTV